VIRDTDKDGAELNHKDSHTTMIRDKKDMADKVIDMGKDITTEGKSLRENPTTVMIMSKMMSQKVNN
jgi:hypothetical protein